MKTSDVISNGIIALIAGGLVVLFIWGCLYLFVWLPATMEANAFNKFSKIKATPWDAIWTDLKVTSQ